MGKCRHKSRKKHSDRTKYSTCYKEFEKSRYVLLHLLEDRSFVRAAHASTIPSGFRRNEKVLFDIAMDYENYRISLSATDGRTYFDSAFPKANHTGKNVVDINGNDINVSGGIEVQYANLVAYDILSRTKSDIGADSRWDETVGSIQHFLAKTLNEDQCDTHGFILRVSRKPEAIPSGLPIAIKAQDFIVVDNQPFIIVDNNIIPIKPENIAVISGQRFALVNGQTFLLPASQNLPSNQNIAL